MLAAGNMCAARKASHSLGRNRVPRQTDQPITVPSSPATIFANHFLFRELGPEIHERLRSCAKPRTVARGVTIFQKGDPGTSLFAVCSGTVQMTALSTSGKNAVFNLIREGEIFGEIALLDGKPRTADAVAFTDCTLLVIERRDFIPLLRSHPDMAIKLLELLCSRLRKTSEQVEDLLFLDLRSRLVKTLLRLSQTAPNAEITISQDDLSHIVGMSREMINKQLQIWVKAGWLRLERRRIAVLRADALAQIVAEE
jgi:CRP/FNR family transcriptional regulator, cyclic AMP receptor protein